MFIIIIQTNEYVSSTKQILNIAATCSVKHVGEILIKFIPLTYALAGIIIINLKPICHDCGLGTSRMG